ncbi:MAG: DUF7507 domain-containing protein [Geminicoccaceae bacterium]
MGAADFYLPGGWNMCDDKSGFKIKNTWAQKQWDNVFTHSRHFEPRHEQDFLRSIQDRQAVYDPRPECEELFLSATFSIPETPVGPDPPDVPFVPSPSLAIVKTATPQTYSVIGETISYSYLVTNDGNVAIDNLAVIDDNVDADVSCPVSELAVGVSTTCTASHTVVAGDITARSITNIAFAKGTDPDGDPVQSPNDSETVTLVVDVVVRVGCFQTPLVTGNVDWTTAALGKKTPKAVEFFMCRTVLDGTPSNHLGAGWGATDGTSEYLALASSEHGFGAIDTFRGIYNNQCVGFFSATVAALSVTATFVSFIEDGVRLNFSLVDDSNEFYVVAIFYTGDSCEVAAWDATMGTQDTPVDVTGIGFEPDMLHSCLTAVPTFNSTFGDCHFNYGMATNNRAGTIVQKAIAWRDVDNVADTEVLSALLSNRMGGLFSTSAVDHTFEVEDFDSDGFSITTRDNNSNSDIMVGLAFRFTGVSGWVGSLNSPTVTGNWVVNDPGFTPQIACVAMLAAQAEDTAETDGDAGPFGMGTFDKSGTGACSVAWAEEDALPDSSGPNNHSLFNDQAIDFTDDEGTQTFAATFLAMSTLGFTLPFTVVDGTTRKWCGWAIEDGA